MPTDGNIPGTISRLNTLDVLAFFATNSLTVVNNVTPSDLKAILERAASGLPDQEGRFLQVSQIRVTYDPSRQAQEVSQPPDGEQAGWIEFGRPYWDFETRAEPLTTLIKPEEGLMLLFPSYIYHRTLPFAGGEERISIAFDILRDD